MAHMNLCLLYVGDTNLVQHVIETYDEDPIREPFRSVAPPLESIINSKISKWYEQGIIENSDSNWSSALVAAKKKVDKILLEEKFKIFFFRSS